MMCTIEAIVKCGRLKPAWAGVVLSLLLNGMAVGTELAAPLAGPATEVHADRFTANWSAVEGATGYFLDVYAYDGIPPTRIGEGFDGYPSVVPDGWAVTNLGGIYTSEGNFGESPPSVKLEEDGHAVVTAVYPAPVTNLSFWYKGQSVSNSFLRVEANGGAGWTVLDTLPVTNKAVTSEFALSASDALRQFRLEYVKDRGNVAVDDVSASYGNASLVFVLTNAAAGNRTSLTVSNLTSGTYYYRVRATDGERVSPDSDVVEVDTAALPIPPVIRPVAPQSVRVGETLEFALTIMPTGGDPVTATNVTPSAGIRGVWSFAEGRFCFSPMAGDVGRCIFTFAAQDKDGVSDATAATVTVRRAQVAALRITGATGAYVQDFDGMSSNGVDNVWDNAAEPLEAWHAYANATAITAYRAGTGSTQSGGLYAFGSEGSADRSLGSLASSGNAFRYGVAFSNETGLAVTNLSVRYTAEQRRVAANSATNTLTFEYCITNRVIPLNEGLWRRVNALCFKTPLVTNAIQTACAADESAVLSAEITCPLLPERVLLLRWSDPDDAGNDHAFGIDDLAVLWAAGEVAESLRVGPSGGTEAFDEMGGLAGSDMPFLWRIEARDDGARVSGPYAAAGVRVANVNGSPNFTVAGGYTFMAGTENDAAVGGLASQSGAKSVTVFAKFCNGTAAPMRRWNVRYAVEKYRNGLTGCSVRLLASTDGETWSTAGAPTSFEADADTNGYPAEECPSITIDVERFVVFAAPVMPEGVFYIAWQYSATDGEETADAQALGIDDVRIVPDPASVSVFTVR